MKTYLKIALVGMAMSFSTISAQGAECPKYSSQFTPNTQVNGPVDEIVDLLMEYAFKMSNVGDAESYHQLVDELNEKLSNLDDKYPDYEPTDEEMAKVAAAFKHYTEVEEEKYYDLEIYSEGEDPEDDSDLYDAELIENILSRCESAGDDMECLCQMFDNGCEDVRSAESVQELQKLSYNYGQALTEYFERHPSVFDTFDENSPAYNRLINKVDDFEKVLINKMEELGGDEEDEDEAVEEIEDVLGEEWEDCEAIGKMESEEVVGTYADLIEDKPDVMPSYPGGLDGLMKYLGDNMRYPKQSEAAGIEGTVIVEFIVGTTGYIESVEILKSVNDELDMEAERLMSGMPKWNPAMKDGKPVRCKYQLPVKFQLK